MALKIKTSTTNAAPALSDLVPGELAYSFVSEKLFIKNPVTNQVDTIGGNWGAVSGDINTQTDLVNLVNNTVSQAMTGVNRVPQVLPQTGTGSDASVTLTGNVLVGATDADGDAFAITGISYGSVSQTVGATFATYYGSFVMQSNGAWTYIVGAAGHALNNGQSGTDVINFRITDSRGGISTYQPLTITVNGSNEAPTSISKSGLLPSGQVVTGNILNGDTDPEGVALTVVSFQYTGSATVFTPGQTATIANVGTFQLAANGAWTFTPIQGFAGQVPRITYTETDGVNQATNTLSLGVAPAVASYQQTIDWFMSYYSGQVAPSNIAPNPMIARAAPSFTTTASYPNWDYLAVLPNRQAVDMSSYDFRVGPGKEYAEIRDVPWLSLLPGDRVFIYYRATPYTDVIPIHVRGEAARWIEVIGVRDPVTGNQPILEGINAVENGNICKFNGAHTGSGLIEIIQPLDGRSNVGYKPGYIHVHGFHIRNAFSGNKLTKYDGTVSTWSPFSAGLKVMGGDRITISGCTFRNNSLGMFANSTPTNGERFITRFLHVLFNYFLDNGMPASDAATHNAYNETLCAIYEFNYFGPNKVGNWGDLLKERSSGQIIRYNYFHSGAENAISLRDPSSTYQLGQTSVDNLGVSLANYSYIYSNTFYLDAAKQVISLGDGTQTSIGQVRGGGKCFFYKNRVIVKCDGSTGYFQNIYYATSYASLFDEWNTIAATTFVAQNNLLYATSLTPTGLVPGLAIFRYQGHPALQGNIAHNVVPDAYLPTTPSGTAVTQGTQYAGTLTDLNITNTNADQGFVNYALNDFSLVPGAPFYSLNTPDPAEVTARNLSSQGDPVNYPFNIPPIPQAVSDPVVTGSAVAGSVLTATDASFSPYTSNVVGQWLKDGVPIQNQTSHTYSSSNADIGHAIRYQQAGTNMSGTGYATSAAVNIVSNTTPQIVPGSEPTITGSRQATFPIQLTNGAWTGNPNAYTYQWFNTVNDTAISGQTTNVFTPDVSYIGQSVYGVVYATNAANEIGQAASAPVTIIAVKYDPDAYGKFNFVAANGTTLKQLDAKWNGNTVVGWKTYDYFMCDGNGVLTTNYVSVYNDGTVWYENGQDTNVAVQIACTPLSSGYVGIALRCTTTQVGYNFKCYNGQVQVLRNGTVVGTYAYTATGSRSMKVAPQTNVANSGVFDIYINGALLDTYTDDTPLTGGFPGISMSIGDTTTYTYCDYWTDNP